LVEGVSTTLLQAQLSLLRRAAFTLKCVRCGRFGVYRPYSRTIIFNAAHHRHRDGSLRLARRPRFPSSSTGTPSQFVTLRPPLRHDFLLS
jgi:hypothetical protein